MSRVVLNQLPSLRVAASIPQKNKRHKVIKSLCNSDFTKAVCECCWNIVNQRVKLTPIQKKKLSRHKTLLRKISTKTTPLQKKKALVQSGGFASLLPLLIGPIISGISGLLKR